MDRIDLHFQDFDHHLWPGPQLVIHINGQPLIDMVQAFEMPFAEREGNTDLAGAYDWLLSVDCELQHLREGSCLVLGSPSGIPEHWSLRVQVCMDEHTVTWGGYENTQRAPGCLNVWDYSAMAPLVFDRRQYEEQMRSLLPVTEGGYHSPWQSVFKTSVEWMKSRNVMHKTIFYAQQLAAEGPPASQADLVRAQAVQRELVRRLML